MTMGVGERTLVVIDEGSAWTKDRVMLPTYETSPCLVMPSQPATGEFHHNYK